MSRTYIGLIVILLLSGCSADTAGPNLAPAAPTTAPLAAQADQATTAPRATIAPTSVPTAEPTATSAPTSTPEPTATAAPTPEPTATNPPVFINGGAYEAYIPAAAKEKQLYQYTCEFDAAWVILNTYGIVASVDDLLGLIPHDLSVEPYYVESADGFVIYGGDITSSYSGDYTANFLARSTGSAMAPVFASYGLETTPVSDRAGVEAALLRGELVWMKTTVDFKPWRPAVWVMPDGRRHQTVLGNDHAVVVMGFNADGAVIRDVLGPTSSNRQRPYEYTVDWGTFMRVWEAQSFDGLAVSRP
ncbi:MAG: hypothetical protein H0T53_04770 [Herpetosiphonaceae bacterium]|nr:hypothetical protein [Herpetosiphonaceae bacterium]